MPCLADELIENVKQVIEKLDHWNLNKIRKIGNKGKSVVGSFSSNSPSKNLIKRKENHAIFLNEIGGELSKHFHYEYSLTNYHFKEKTTSVIYFTIFRKNDTQEIGEGINGIFIKMLHLAPFELQLETRLEMREISSRWVYNLKKRYFFDAYDFTFKDLYKRSEINKKIRFKLRIPTRNQLISLLVPSVFKNRGILENEFINWKQDIEHEDKYDNAPVCLFLRFFMHFKYKKTWGHRKGSWISSPEKFRINKYLSLILEEEKTEIYINGQHFLGCKYLLFNIPHNNRENFDDFNSIDEISEYYDKTHKRKHDKISPADEFWGHCSNLQSWYEHNYDTRILHSNLSFPLLRALTEAGDPLAKKVFKDEIAKRFEYNYKPVIISLLNNGYLNYLSREELSTLSEAVKNPLFKLLIKFYRTLKIYEDYQLINEWRELKIFKNKIIIKQRYSDRITIQEENNIHYQYVCKISRNPIQFTLNHSNEKLPFAIIESFNKPYFYFPNNFLVMKKCFEIVYEILDESEDCLIFIPRKPTKVKIVSVKKKLSIYLNCYKINLKMLSFALNTSRLFPEVYSLPIIKDTSIQVSLAKFYSKQDHNEINEVGAEELN